METTLATVTGSIALYNSVSSSFMFFVIRGMGQLLERSPDATILMEFAPSLQSRAGLDPAAVLDELAMRGFEIRRVE